MKTIPIGIKIIVLGHLLMGAFSAFLGILNMLSIYYFQESLLKAFFFFCFFSFLTFWFFAFAKLNQDLNPDLISFNMFGLFFAILILPGYKFFIYFQPGVVYTQRFGEIIILILSKVIIPAGLYSIWSVFYTKLIYSKS